MNLLMLLAAAAASTASAPDGSTVVVDGVRPPTPPGSPVPVLRDDRWATVRVALDRRGNAMGCRIVATNLRRTEDRWRACHQVKLHFATDEAARAGIQLPATVQRTLLVRSLKSRWSEGGGYRRVHIY